MEPKNGVRRNFDARLPPPVQEQQDRKLQSWRGSLKVFGQAAKASVMTEN